MDFIIKDANASEKMIESNFDKQTRTYLNLAINKGYDLAKIAIENTNFLNYDFARGEELLPILKNFAVEFVIIKYIENGLIPYHYEINQNKNKSARYFLLFDSERKIELCVNQVKTRNSIGRKAFYRDDRIESFNSYFIFDNVQEQEPKIIDNPPIYFELNHGYQTSKPHFVVLGIPGTKGKWINKMEISKELTLVQDTGSIKTKVEDIEFDFGTLQDYIEKSGENE